MSIAHLLEDFTVSTPANQLVREMSDDDIEDIRLASYEQGYQAGWDDAIVAQNEEKTRVTSLLARHLEDFSFTYQEALSQMTRSIEPVFRAMIEKVLPEAMSQAMGTRIIEQCTALAKDQVDQPVAIVVPRGARETLLPILKHDLHMELSIRESDALSPGQVQLRIGDQEREIDGDHLLAMLSDSVDAYYHTLTEEPLYG